MTRSISFRWGGPALIAALTIDQVTKTWALSALWPPGGNGFMLLPVLNLRLTFNAGISFGLLSETASGAVWLMVAAMLGIVVWFSWWLWTARTRYEAVALGLIVGGALGNIIDRLRHGEVVDFIDAHYRGWHWPTFNGADIAIVGGAAIILAGSLLSRRLSARLRT